MRLIKDGVSVELTNEIQISAYLKSGYTEKVESEKTDGKIKKGTKANGKA